MELGVQLYGLSAICRNNSKQFFENLKEMGYHFVEPCLVVGFSDGSEPSGFWNPSETAMFMSTLKDAGLYTISCHVLLKTDCIKTIINLLKELNCQYNIRQFVFGCPVPVTKENYTSYAAMLCAIATDLQEINVEFLLHNGPNEIQTKLDGITAYEWLLDACNGLVFAQPDIGWLLYGGMDPICFLERNKDRIRSIHYKDMMTNYKNLPTKQCDIRIGMGCVDINSCYQFALANNLLHIVDQDQSDNDIMEDLLHTQNLLSLL